MKACRTCQHMVSEEAVMCPNCGVRYPALDKWDGWGYEYKSKARVGNLPLLHISFKYRPNRLPVVARGVIAIGQFAAGMITISQFGVGIISISQFTVGLWALCQVGIAWSLVAQIGLYVQAGKGQLVMSVADAIAWLLG